MPDTDSTTYGVKYDYHSVMHYAKDAFASAPGKITMETVDKQYQVIDGTATAIFDFLRAFFSDSGTWSSMQKSPFTQYSVPFTNNPEKGCDRQNEGRLAQ